MKSSSESVSDPSTLVSSAANSNGLAETLRLPFFDGPDCFGVLKASRVYSLDEDMGRRQLGPQVDISMVATTVKQNLDSQGLSSSFMSCALVVGGLLKIPAECG